MLVSNKSFNNMVTGIRIILKKVSVMDNLAAILGILVLFLTIVFRASFTYP